MACSGSEPMIRRSLAAPLSAVVDRLDTIDAGVV
jgi:hypothetical protein